MAVIVNGDGILTGISNLATDLTDITSGRGTITGVTTVGTLQLGAGVSISSPRTQQAAIFTNNTEFLTIDDAGRVGVGTITPNSDAHPENEKKINVGFITARSIAGDIDANTMVVAGVSTFVGALNAAAISGTTGTFTGDIDIASSLVHTGDTDTKVQFTTDNISLVTGGTTRVNITSGGNLEMPNDNDYIKIGAGGDLQLVHTGAASIIQNGTGALQLQSSIVRFDNASGTEYGRFDSAGRLNVGPAAAVSQTRNVNIGSNSEANLAIETHNDAASESANIRFYKSRGTAGSPTAVADNHYIGQMLFYGQDGTDYANTVGYMRVGVDGTVASNQIPGEMEFGINDGSSVSRAMTIHKSGNVLFSGLTAKNDGRNAKGIALKSVSGGAGISFETFGANGSRNWRIRPDDMTGWGSLEFSVSPTTNDATDWPDEAADVVLSLQGDKDVKINNGNLILTNTKGISFYNHGTGTNIDNNLLDDYEEGSFTPEYNTGSAGSAMLSAATYTNTSGFYTKIGRLVYVVLRIECASHTVMGGIVQINNLPFACQNVSGAQAGGFFHYINALDSTNTGYTPTLYIAGGSSYIQMYETDGSSYQAGRGGTNWNNQLHLSVIYNTN